ncbi:Wnt-10a [Paramuricea clavata]|uniref:Protein Wnt n=1 Tax=Paramuricea clavata TaxID=317549 RepID=A0A6S7FHF9_PARCT|nr:Wnt-10a [Paramuricea clavata]
MNMLWNWSSHLWCLAFLVLLCNSISFGNEIRPRRNRLNEVQNPTSKSPSGIWESEENRKTKTSTLCMNRALNAKQMKLCLKFPLQVAAAFRAYREAVKECQYQFRDGRWNCDSLVSMRGQTMQPLVTKFMTRGFKEVAFVQALVAASVAKAVSLDCARGVMSSCDKIGSKKRRSKKDYVNYNEAIAHGIYFSEKFLNSGQSSHDVQGMVSRHNFRAGRLVFMNTLKTMCKCHGLSGACTAKTCVKTASGLRLIGNAVKTIFNNAKKVEPENQRREGLKLVLVDAPTKTENSPRFGKAPKEVRETPTKSELLYTENSPSFCERDDTLGTLGVSGYKRLSKMYLVVKNNLTHKVNPEALEFDSNKIKRLSIFYTPITAAPLWAISEDYNQFSHN